MYSRTFGRGRDKRKAESEPGLGQALPVVRVEITDLTKPQQNQVFTAPACIFPPRIKIKNRIFYTTPPSRYNAIAKEEFAMKDKVNVEGTAKVVIVDDLDE